MDTNQNLLVSSQSQQVFPYSIINSDANYISQKPSRGDFLLQELHHLDQMHASSFPFDTPPYGNGLPDLDFFECKPFQMTCYGQGHVMDNFQLSTNMICGIPEQSSVLLDYPKDVKPLSFFMPDEASYVDNPGHVYCDKTFADCKGRYSTSSSSCSRRSYKDRQKAQLVKGQWTVNEDRWTTSP
ncbi:hypothetical protein MLD38_027915 [Melastoma candidum]|uniref:Uncharacterized protein n=1 Tax=Melastoma candidum TaxID=119954 RepID=A0ACB9N0B4_9MYRT|nr:hypothetical protein MLD38_027915 [Melastoma candidum]